MRLFFSTYLEAISFALYFIALLYYAFRVDRSKAIVWLCVYYGLATLLLVRVSIGLGFRIDKVNTHFYNMLYLLMGFFMGGYFFFLLMRPWKKGVAVVVGLSTVLYYIYNSVVNTEPYFDSIGFALTSIGIVILLFIHLHQHLQHIKEERLVLNFTFWFSCVLLFYYFGGFAIFLSFNYFTQKLIADGYLYETREILTYLWIVHNVILFLGGIATALGILWISRREYTSS